MVLLEWSFGPTHSVPTRIKKFSLFLHCIRQKWGFIQISPKALLFITAQSVPSQMQRVGGINIKVLTESI